MVLRETLIELLCYANMCQIKFITSFYSKFMLNTKNKKILLQFVRKIIRRIFKFKHVMPQTCISSYVNFLECAYHAFELVFQNKQTN